MIDLAAILARTPIFCDSDIPVYPLSRVEAATLISRAAPGVTLPSLHGQLALQVVEQAEFGWVVLLVSGLQRWACRVPLR